jgi:hypothetical protein
MYNNANRDIRPMWRPPQLPIVAATVYDVEPNQSHGYI